MASSKLSVIFAVLAIFVPLVLAKEHIVGDAEGWKINIDYDAWAKANKFAVGDTLLFKYQEGSHNVVEVKEEEYAQCKAPADAKTLASGKDLIKLDAPGKRYFICTIGKHCANKQKIAIDVGGASSATAGPTASSPEASGLTDSTAASSPKGLGGADIAPAPGPHNSAATLGGRFGWMVVILTSGIIGFLIA